MLSLCTRALVYVFSYLFALAGIPVCAAARAVTFETVSEYDYQPSAHTSLSLDGAVRSPATGSSSSLQRAKSFIERAATHPRWSGHHYDPGWGRIAAIA